PVSRDPRRAFEAAARALGLEPARVLVHAVDAREVRGDALGVIVVERRGAGPCPELRGVREKGRSKLPGALESARRDAPRSRRVAPQAREARQAGASLEIAAAQEHPLEAAARPEAAIGECLAERGDHRAGAARLELVDR